jgi:hypothetical protein
VEWGVARYVLHEYAAAVAVDSKGQVQHDPDPQLPVLQLAAVNSEQLGREQGGPCGVLGHVSPLDRLQLEVIPAARTWVLAHVEEVPALSD